VSDAAREMQALREGVGLTEPGHVVVLRVEGEGAFALLDCLSTAPLYLREGQLRQTLFLDESARPLADAYVASDEAGYLVLAEGLDAATLLDYVEKHRPATASRERASVASLASSHELLGLHGPYAWELAGAFLGPAVLGMPYLSLLVQDDVVCFRAGKTGEYGYDFLVPRARAAEIRERLRMLGEPFELTPLGLPTLDQAALENWFFSVRTLRETATASPLTPIELQAQWRVGYARDFVGAQALRARKAEGPRVRATSFTAPVPVAPGDLVLHAARQIGEVLAAGFSHTLGAVAGVALIETRHAHPHIDAFTVRSATGETAIRTRTPPLVNNRSLYVDPHRHAYQTRAGDAFPPLVLT